ncbi:flagellar hook-associated protein FlgK [Aliiroseovarius sp. PTFE2010]|uniref:flagellar hook-associated protein FlgK n=1 Tax=Aliiroseovarius sp. PTFE2010 TaxID=3417190 RepID=UPI003CF30116
MSISGSLNNALSGLAAASRAADIVSSNVANAMTDGYGRRELELSARTVAGNGAGVDVVGVTRHSDPQLLGERRAADAEVAMNAERLEFFERMERAIGIPGDESSLANQISHFESTLVEASSSPESDTRLGAVLDAAQSIVKHLNATSDEIQTTRMEADQAIGRTVDTLNENLQKVVDLNVEIQQQLTSGRDATALMDHRQVLIDSIAEVIPVKEVAKENGKVSLYTPGGAILVDSKAAEIGFSSVGVITADMTLASGALSGLTINGQPTTTSSSRSPIEGGRLAALFEVRDELATGAQAQLDAVARDLIERFEDPGVDPSLLAGDPGLFTDAGAALDVLDEVGLAGRLSVNAAVDPSAGGALWRLRAGVNAASAGEVGDSTLLNAMQDAMSATRTPASGGFSPLARSASQLAADFLSNIEGSLLSAQSESSYATAKSDSLRDLELKEGVDTDQEMQKLLLIEQMYAANARVVSTIDTLIGQLLEI